MGTIPNTDTSAAAAAVQAGALRRLRPERRLELSVEMSLLARALLHARVRTEHPDWSETAVNLQILRLASADVVLPPQQDDGS
jgi:hypothetical protein